MEPMIQVAGIRSAAEAAMVARAGATHLGFPLRLDVHAPDVDEDEARAIIAGLPVGVRAVLITYATDPDEVAGLCRFLGAHGVQLHAPMEPRAMRRLRGLVPDLLLIKSVVLGREADGPALDQVRAFAPMVDAFLTDTFDPATGASGATGKTHDWALSAELVRQSPRPVILAGGLGPDNVARAIARVRPAGVDAHTGLEDALGAKDAELCRAFAGRANQAFAALQRR